MSKGASTSAVRSLPHGQLMQSQSNRPQGARESCRCSASATSTEQGTVGFHTARMAPCEKTEDYPPLSTSTRCRDIGSACAARIHAWRVHGP